jgi:hypothetical protein
MRIQLSFQSSRIEHEYKHYLNATSIYASTNKVEYFDSIALAKYAWSYKSIIFPPL